MGKRKIENELYFRNIVRSRDNWTCQRCGSIEYPQVHHINSVSDYPLFKNLPQYGITLCVYCHADAHPEIPRNLFIANVIKAEKEGCISAGKLAKELNVNPRTIVRKAIKLGILKPMQKWMFTEQEAELLRKCLLPKLMLRGKQIERTYYIPKELSDKLRDASFYLKKPQSEIVRNALELYLYSPEVCEAIRNDMKRLGGENRIC